MVRKNRAMLAAASVGASAVLVLALAGCTVGDEPADAASMATDVSTSAAAPEPSPSPSPESKSPEDLAVEAAEPMVYEFYQIEDAASQNPDTFRREEFRKVAEGTALADTVRLFEAKKERGVHQVGSTELISVDVDEVEISYEAWDRVVFRVCYDVSGLDIVDENGESTVTQDRNERGVSRVTVGTVADSDGEWHVGTVEYLTEETC
ncbi:hypothetical protein [Myceligenerans indicum]|uniref:Lipoprotein n=1 Tax=Myceligenerans indicum TaxID=2593663 RepID=A0ABS1LET0_9MICO|nr:hypothetical protein [Myceligenerans indicum]MBL0884765.1 hypothetical protein [Myceligenerans indicum]